MSWDVGAWVINTLKNFLNTNLVTNHGSQVFTANGTFTVPAGVYSIKVIAAGGGGGGGASCIDRRFAVTPGQQIDITIGGSGSGGSTNINAGNGGSTVVGTLITVPGGKGAESYSYVYAHTGGLAGGNGGGAGGSSGKYTNSTTYIQEYLAIPRGGDGLFGSGGREGNVRSNYGVSGGGGGSFGNGGNGAYYNSNTDKFIAPTAGSYGGGGGGGGYHASSYKSTNGAKGGAGICIIEW